MPKAKLNPKMLEILQRKTKFSEQVIRNALSNIRSRYPVTLNAAAHIYAQKKGISGTARYLTEEDRNSLKGIEFKRIPIKIPQKRREKIIEIAKFETPNKFLKKHLDEINRCYTYHCYTACYVLMRKVLENLVVEILKRKYPENTKEHKQKYYDFNRKRNNDFNVLLKNLRNSSKDFGTQQKIVERICQLADFFKETANEMTHSLYHIADKKEIDGSRFQEILDLFKELGEV